MKYSNKLPTGELKITEERAIALIWKQTVLPLYIRIQILEKINFQGESITCK